MKRLKTKSNKSLGKMSVSGLRSYRDSLKKRASSRAEKGKLMAEIDRLKQSVR